MSVLNFDNCWARPELPGGAHLLTNHLKQSAEHARKVFSAKLNNRTTNLVNGQALIDLIYISVLSHDLGKSHAKWQEYIRGRKNKGPGHAHCSAFLFTYVAYQWLIYHEQFENYKKEWLWLAQDIADHHSDLKFHSEGEFDWVKSYEWDKMDLEGMSQWLSKTIPETHSEMTVKLTSSILEEWVDTANQIIGDIWFDEFDPEEKNYHEMMNELQYWRSMTGAFIFGDRMDSYDYDSSSVDVETASRYLNQIDKFCKASPQTPMSKVRNEAQQSVLKQFENQKDSSIYTLAMPTGYGKTMTAMKLAAKMCYEDNKQKIVYVAPYLSILEQTGESIEKTLGDKPLEHHSLALLPESSHDNNVGDTNYENKAPLQLISDSWNHHIICTSFQQFMKALFPYKAQDSMRRAMMQDTVILIDEPQIFSADVWNLFLTGLESFVKEYNAKVMFLSATLPPFSGGLTSSPSLLKVEEIRETPRFKIEQIESHNESTLADRVHQQEKNKKAVILNTVADAIFVHDNLNNLEDNVQLLHGLMAPIHKMIKTKEIQKKLENEKPLTVVATQVLEAGVDISVEYMYRALPILPSLIQAAGRVNRHNEYYGGLIETGEFLREGTNTRQFIYEKGVRQITDDILADYTELTEFQVGGLIKEYYRRMFTENFYDSILLKIEQAYSENWKNISQFNPFGSDYFKLPVFIPWDFNKVSKDEWPKTFAKLIDIFKINSAEQVYELYEDYDFIYNLDFEKRKQFTMLFYYFVLNLPVKRALSVANREVYLQQKIPRIYDDGGEIYHHELGWRIKKSEDSWDSII